MDPTAVGLGAYWVLYPGNPIGRADAFISKLDSQCPGWRDRPFVLQVDCEIWNSDKSTQPGVSDINAFCDRLVARMPRLRPLVYASAGQYKNTLAGLKYPLWNANYPSKVSGSPQSIYAHVGGDTGVGWNSYSGKVPALWQFTDVASIGGQVSDASAYRGTFDQFMALVAPGWELGMSITNADADVILGRDVVPIGGGTYGNGVTGTWSFVPTVGRIYDDVHASRAANTDILAQVRSNGEALSALAAGLAQLVDPAQFAEAVVSLLVERGVGGTVTTESLQAAVVAAFRELAGTPTA